MEWDNIINVSLIYATWRSTIPIMYAALCAAVTQQANILNIGTEGIMLMGAFTAVVVSYYTSNWFLGVIVAMIVGMLFALIMGVGSIKFKADINAIGIAINMLALALTKFLLNTVVGVAGTFSDPSIDQIPDIHIPFFDGVPFVDDVFNNWALTEWLVIFLVVGLTYLLYKTPWGLRVRSVGENELAAVSVGINTTLMKYQVMIISGLIGGLAGAHLSLGYSNFFTENMTNNRGFMGVAAMYFGGAHPVKTAGGTLLFGFVDSIGARLQSYGWPAQIVLSLPYIVTIVVLSISLMNLKRRNKRIKSSLD